MLLQKYWTTLRSFEDYDVRKVMRILLLRNYVIRNKEAQQ